MIDFSVVDVSVEVSSGLKWFDVGFGRRDPRIGPGIYLLLEHGDVVYVGKAVNMLHRFATHASGKPPVKEFDSARLFPVQLSDLDWVESSLIRTIRPRLNLVVPRPVSRPYKASHAAKALVKCAESRTLFSLIGSCYAI